MTKYWLRTGARRSGDEGEVEGNEVGANEKKEALAKVGKEGL